MCKFKHKFFDVARCSVDTLIHINRLYLLVLGVHTRLYLLALRVQCGLGPRQRSTC